MKFDLRDLESVSASTAGVGSAPPDQIDELLRVLDTQLVERLIEDWATPVLIGDKDPRGADYTPEELRAALSGTPLEDGILDAALRLLNGRALALALIRCPPAWLTWERCADSFQSASWEGFVEQLRRSFSENRATELAWIRILTSGPASPSQAVLTITDDERTIVQETSRAWLARPTAFPPSAFRTYYPSRSAVRAALEFLRAHDPASWFEGLRNAKLPSIVAESVESVARRLDEILVLLRHAPVAIAEGRETCDVAAVLLARSALGYPARVYEALQSALRGSTGEQKEALTREVESFQTQVLLSMVDEVVVAIADRVDGDELARVMLLELVATASRTPLKSRDRSVEMEVLNACASQAGAGFEANPGESLWRWFESSELTSSDAGFVRYLACVLATPSPPGTGQLGTEDATALWVRFLEVLPRGSRTLRSFSDAATVPSWVFPTAAVPLACLDDPVAAFEVAFSGLETERVEESGARDYESRSLGSRTLTHVACAAAGNMAGSLVRHHQEDEREQFCRTVWRAVRRLWLRAPLQIGEDIDHLVLYFFAWLPLSLGMKSSFVPEALSFLIRDPNLAPEVARVWYSSGIAPSEIISAFDKVGQPLEELLEAMEAGSGSWSPPTETVQALRDVVEGVQDRA